MVKKRGEVYYLRLYVPKDVQDIVGCKEFVKSLGTGRIKHAKSIAASIQVTANKVWQRVKFMQQRLSPQEIKSMVNKWLEKELQQFTDPSMAPMWLTDHSPHEREFLLDELSDQTSRLKHLAQFPKYEYQASDEALADGAPSDGSEKEACLDVIGQLLKEHDIEQIDDESNFYLMRQVAAAMMNLTLAQRDALLNIVPVKAKPAELPTAQSQEYAATEPILLLSEALQYRLEEVELKRAKTTAIKFKGQIPTLLKVLGDKPVNQYKRSEFINAHKVLKLWPSKASLLAPDESLESILKRTDLGEPIADNTVFTYLILMSTVFKFCVESGWIEKSPVPKWEKPVKLNCNDIIPFSDEQLAKLFDSPHFTSPARRKREPHNFWIPLIALFTGMRMDEICQLYVKDIVEVDGVLCFNATNTGDDQKTKNHKSRYVPVHSALIKQGLLKYVGELERTNQARLFPALQTGIRGYSTGFGKNINKYLQRHVTAGIPKGRRPTFHSFRKNFSQALTAKAVSHEITATLLGHASVHKVTVNHYTGAYPPTVLREAVELVEFKPYNEAYS